MGIKDEIQGQTGYLKKVRDNYMPDTKKMADLAFESYKADHDVDIDIIKSDVDSVLKELFVRETQIFVQKNNDIMTQVLPYYYEHFYNVEQTKYEETEKRITTLLDLYTKIKGNKCSEEEFIKTISKETVDIFDVVSFSQKQSAKCRVGETLQNHLSNIFDICKIPCETQQQKAEGGTIMDFVIPNFSAIEEMPDQVINIECQTTLKDRFRLTTGKSTDARLKRYLATITGAGIVTKRDTNDFSVEKVKEIIMDNNVTLIVLSEVKANILTKINLHKLKLETGKRVRDNVSLEDTKRLLRLSDKKIISYTDLVNRDIQSILLYWK